MNNLSNIKEVSVMGKTVVIRLDINCPVENGIITNPYRINRSLTTIEYLLTQKVKKIIVLTHLGRPEGFNPHLSLMPVFQQFKAQVGIFGNFNPVNLRLIPFDENIDNCINEINSAEEEIVFLENIRFWQGETKKDPIFAKKIASLGEIFINDAFSSCHRNHASIAGINYFLPSFAGFLLMEEIEKSNLLKENPKKPSVIIIGGKKAEEKIRTLDALSQKYDKILIGGLVADFIFQNSTLRQKYAQRPFTEKIILPFGWSDEKNKDIDLKTANFFAEIIQEANTIFWTGPLGEYENPPYDNGSKIVIQAIVDNNFAYKITGGAATDKFLKQNGFFEQIDFVSTGGAALLEMIAGEKLPGLEPLIKENLHENLNHEQLKNSLENPTIIDKTIQGEDYNKQDNNKTFCEKTSTKINPVIKNDALEEPKGNIYHPIDHSLRPAIKIQQKIAIENQITYQTPKNATIEENPLSNTPSISPTKNFNQEEITSDSFFSED